MTTLLSVLTQKKPELSCAGTAKKNTTNPKWPIIDPANIRRWVDFNLSVLKESYGHILDEIIPEERLARMPRVQHVDCWGDIKEHTDMTRLIGWNHEMLRPALEFAKEKLVNLDGVHLSHKIASSGLKKLNPFPGGKTSARALVDHQVALRSNPTKNLIFGLGVPSSKFDGSQAAERPGTTGFERLWPLR